MAVADAAPAPAPEPKEAVIEMPAAAALASMLGGLEDDVSPTIIRAPEYVRKGIFHPHDYEPTRVSIGPFHRGLPHLQAMEKYKRKSLRDLISRTRNPADHTMLDILARKMHELEARARRCYGESIGLISSDEFVEMMILDGCFILSLLIENFVDSFIPRNFQQLRTDVLKLENQIPHFVLQSLFDTFMMESGDRLWPPGHERREVSLLDLAVQLLKSAPPLLRGLHTKDISAEVAGNIQHMLHLLQIGLCLANLSDGPSREPPSNGGCGLLGVIIADMLGKTFKLISFLVSRLPSISLQMIVSRPPTSSDPFTGYVVDAIPTAADLQEMGVTFKRKMTGSQLFDYSFSNGIMEISYICMSPYLKSVYMNAILFEQYNAQSYMTFSTYACFMNAIINTSNDVSILRGLGIIESQRASDEEVATYFHQLSKICDVRYASDQVFKDVNKYCESKCHRWMAALKRNYFSTPWSTASVVAAIILLILSFLQTYFAIYSYFPPPHVS